MKVCSNPDCHHAGQPQPLENFYPNKRGKFGKHSRCKICASKACKTWRSNNPDYQKEWRAKHLHERRDYERKHASNWRKNNRDRANELKREQYKRHPETFKASRQRKHAARRAKLLQAPGRFSAEDIQKIFILQKERCWWCGISIAGNYEIDHRIPLSKGGTNWPSNIVLTCRFCNRSKNNKLPDEFYGRLL